MQPIARFFIQRPIACMMLAIAIILSGLLAWRMLAVAALPQVDFPVIVVRANLPGASPESMASTVAAPLERALGAIAGVSKIQSNSNQGGTSIVLEFALDRNINDAAREVQAAINAARAQLPAGMSGNPSYTKVNPSQAPIMALALSSVSLPASVLYDNASTILAQKIAQIAGVGEVTVDGSSLPAVRVQLDAAALIHKGLSMEDARLAINRANAWRPLGHIETGSQRWQLALSPGMRTAQDFEQLIVHQGEAGVVRLRDVAVVTDSVENRFTAGYHNQNSAVILLISRRQGANIVQTIDAIQAAMPQLQALLPTDTQLSVVMDRSPGIRATLVEAQWTLLLTCLLVVAVVWAFLGSLRSALIPAVALPISLIGAFTIMWWQGFSLNNLSLMALIVAAGLVVDDAVVVLENVQRHLHTSSRAQARSANTGTSAEHSETAPSRFAVLRAALRGSAELGSTLIAMNAALVVVFLAILFMGGIVEKLFREFSITLVAAIVLSLLVSISITPALCAHTLAVPRKRAAHPLVVRGQALFANLQAVYADTLAWLLRHGWLVLLLMAGLLAANVWLYTHLPKSMLPTQDTGQLNGFIRGDDGFSFQVMQPKVELFRQHILADPAVADVTGTSGGRGGISNSWFRIRLKPLAERGVSAAEVAARIRSSAPSLPGAMLLVNVEQDIRLQTGQHGGEGEYFLVLRSDSTSTLRQWARPIGDALEALPELVNVNVPGAEDAQQVELTIDRAAAQRLGISMSAVASTLNNAFSQRQVATLYDNLNQYKVVMELDPLFGSEPAALEHIDVLNSTGQSVPLAAFSSWSYGLSQDRVFHDSQFAALGIEYGIAPGITELQAKAAIDTALAGLMLPANVYTGERTADAISVAGTVKRQPWLILGVLVAVYLVLGMLYESTVHPITILSTLPCASVGALLALWLSGTPFSLIALLGLFLLIGVVMKNAILMIDFALEAQRKLGLPAHTAILQAAQQRLRPILMTNMAALLGAVPLVLGFGEGSELRRPLGIAIIGGLAISQLLTLFTTPVLYLYLERLRQWRKPARPAHTATHTHDRAAQQPRHTSPP